MKKLFPTMLVWILLLSAIPAQAFQTRAEDPALRTLLQVMGQAFAPAAAKLGCTTLVSANYTDPENRSALLEYLPQAQSPESWSRMFSVAVYTLEGDPARQRMTMMTLSGALLKAFEQHGKVLQKLHYANASGEPGMFIEFEMGQGAQKEHNAGIFMRTSKQAAAFIQVQSRGKPLSKDDVLTMHKMITPNPQEVPPPNAAEQQAAVPAIPQPQPQPQPFTAPEVVAPVEAQEPQEDIAPGLWEGEPAWRLEQQLEQQQAHQPPSQQQQAPTAKSWLEQH